MLCFVVYDISDDRLRGRLFKELKKAGLTHVQYSCFLGNLDESRIDELEQLAESLIEDTDACYLFPICDEDFGKVRIVGADFDHDLVADRLRTMVL